MLGLQIAEIFYGVYLATEVSYYTYIYAKVQRDRYETVTAQTRAAVFLGRFIGGVSGQILVFTHLMNYKELNYLTLGSKTRFSAGLKSFKCNNMKLFSTDSVYDMGVFAAESLNISLFS